MWQNATRGDVSRDMASQWRGQRVRFDVRHGRGDLDDARPSRDMALNDYGKYFVHPGWKAIR